MRLQKPRGYVEGMTVDEEIVLWNAAFAALPMPEPATAEKVAALKASIPDLLGRCYIGPPNAKGRQAMWFKPK